MRQGSALWDGIKGLRRVSRILLAFEIWYSALLMLSIVFVVPHYVLADTRGGFMSLLRSELQSEPEWESVISFLSPVVWILIPLSSIILGVLSWLAYSTSIRSKGLDQVIRAGATILFAMSLLPALLTFRELLLYEQVHIFGIFSVGDSLNYLAGLTRYLLDPTLIAGWGTLAVASVIFVETGLFFGFFLPGDSLLVTLGILAAAGRVDLLLLIPFATLAAIAGDQLNYFVGQRAGDTLAKRYTFFAKRLEQARVFYERHGAKAIVLARFVPVVRTFAPAAAGAVGMKYRRFVAANVVGGVFWVLSATLAGFVLGRILPVAVVSNLGLIVAVVIFISILPYLLAAIRAKLHG